MNSVDWIVFCYPRGRRHLTWDGVVYFTKDGQRGSTHFRNLYQKAASDIYEPWSFLGYWSEKRRNKKRVGWAGFDSHDMAHVVKLASGWHRLDDSNVKIRFNNWLLIDPWAGKIVDEDGDALHEHADAARLLEGWGGIQPMGDEEANDELFHACLSPTPYKIKKWSGCEARYGYTGPRSTLTKLGKTFGGMIPESRWQAALNFIGKHKDHHEFIGAEQVQEFLKRNGHLPPQYNEQAVQKCLNRRIRRHKHLDKASIAFLQMMAAGNSFLKHTQKTA